MGWKSEKIMELLGRVEALEIAAGIKAPPESLSPAAPRVTRRIGDISQDGPPVPIPEPSPEDALALQRWEVWSEGYAATVARDRATYHGVFAAATWAQAVDAWARTLSERALQRLRNVPGTDVYTFWGCRLYDNERDARASFG